MAAAWPICLGYLPIGLAFGVLAQKAGLSPLQIGLMSVFVFASLGYGSVVSPTAAVPTIPGAARIVGQGFGGAAYQLASR